MGFVGNPERLQPDPLRQARGDGGEGGTGEDVAEVVIAGDHAVEAFHQEAGGERIGGGKLPG